MRLTSLKLSGFKSFADSTTLHFKDNRTAVVGPNGCGKSNVIDAIRWVMGESSARQLRGGSMQDVIFTGTAQRKPVGMASVELRFDNTLGKLGGAYNAYSELSVRRQVNREGKSEYFLNGTRCRRRDITDIFLGTGLGPRSYAVIEQGMISRLVEAKPDEMRVFIEEAAGVSRYQARRKETLQHLEQAEQNLSRLHDIDSELEKQLKTLQRQVEAALQYTQLEQDIQRLKIESLSYQIEQNQHKQQHYQQQLSTLSEQFKTVRVELQQAESVFQVSQQRFQQLLQQSTPLQTEWQDAEKHLAELTAQMLQKKNSFEQNQKQLQQLEVQQHSDHEKAQIIDLQLEQADQLVAQYEDTLKQHQAQVERLNTQLGKIKQQQHGQSQQLQQLQQQLQQWQQQQQHAKLHYEQLNKNIQRIEQQRQTLEQQQSQVQTQHIADVDALQHDYDEQQQQLQQLQQDLEQCNAQAQQAQHAYDVQQEQARQAQADLHILQAEHSQLSQLVAKESPEQEQYQQLLQQLQLHDDAKPYVALVEQVLAEWLNAQLLEQQHDFSTQVARQIRLNADVQTTSTWHSDLAHLPTLQDWIATPQRAIWQDVKCVENYAQAIVLQGKLTTGQSILTLDGYWLGADWQIALAYDQASQAQAGGMRHRLRLDELAPLIATQQQQLEKLQQATTEAKHTWQQLQQQQQQLQQQIQQQQQQVQQLALQLTKAQSQQQAFAVQQQQLQQQLQHLQIQVEEDALQRDDLEIDLHALNLKIEQLLPDVQSKQQQADDFDQQLDDVQQQLQQQTQLLNQAQKAHLQQLQQVELLQKDLSFLVNQQQKQKEQSQFLQSSLLPLQTELPSLQKQLDEQATLTVALQDQWQAWQEQLNQAQQQQQQSSEQRQQLQQQDEQLRQQLEEQRLAWQQAKSDVEHYQVQLMELQHEPVLGLQIDVQIHQQQIVEKQQKLEKIGAVNLIASQEYQDIMTRHEQLNHQIQDVESTVNQLKDAMKSIDQETKSLFMTTFEQINRELQILFPKIFNGGEAQLTLEQDWQSGVKLMARPPGKRNSSLALLSGGEKALTALALVFAIFRLNPAPFCVLDEVDAPLDDANVQRFCHLVKELSEQVQFIYITHNKLAMTMATDLLGVTMPEAGTSKLVAVNLEEAKEYGLMESQDA
ncbi:MAG: chromosome segregation protein SMC [Acinetobacter sp.]|nr:chromosome segregation protein SMC [Acinetobacter sp.]